MDETSIRARWAPRLRLLDGGLLLLALLVQLGLDVPELLGNTTPLFLACLLLVGPGDGNLPQRLWPLGVGGRGHLVDLVVVLCDGVVGGFRGDYYQDHP